MMVGLLAAAAVAAATATAAPEGRCLAAGQWEGRDGTPTTEAAAMDGATGATFLLLGEEHANPAHHRLQARVAEAMLARGRPVVLALEQLPRSSQPALDRWVSGTIDEAAFLAESRWSDVWGHDFAAYRPVFALARARGVPMVALNVERAFLRSVSKSGFDLAAKDGAPVGKPAPADPAYRAFLEGAFRAHAREASADAVSRFVDAQTVWDRAFAEGMRDAARSHPGASVIGLMGHGHVRNGWGAEHQLRALGETAIWSLVPVPAVPPCSIPAGAADALVNPG
jgi:uncharacterized iron-regulated protein